MSDVELKFICRYVHHAQSVEPNHKHPCHELIYYFSGEGTSVIGKDHIAYRAGTYAYIPPMVKHSEIHSTKTEVFFFGFEHQESGVELRGGVYQDDDGTVAAAFKEIEREMAKKEPYFRYAVRLNICKILLAISRKNKAGGQNVLEECMNFAKEYILQNVHQSINLHDIANSVGYSYDYFRHQFQKHFGISVKEFILREKIVRIKIELAGKNTPIAELAEKYSFHSASHLARIFKDIAGVSPTEYRNAARAEKNELLVDYEENDKKADPTPEEQNKSADDGRTGKGSD